MDIKGIFENFLEGNKKISMLGGVPLEIISEKSIDSSMTIPTKRVENGFNISDSLRKNPLVFDITVVDNSKDYLLNRNALYALQEKGELVDFYFSGRDTYENIAVESISEIETSQQYQGFTYHIALRQIQIAEIDESDVQLDSKKAETSGGKKKITTASTSAVTEKEKEKVDAVRETSAAKGIYNSVVGGDK